MYEIGIKKVDFVGVDAKGKETRSIGGSAVGLTQIPTGAVKAVITVEDAQIRYWVDGSNPTLSSGHLVNVGDVIKLDSSGQISKFKAISVSGTANLQVTYF